MSAKDKNVLIIGGGDTANGLLGYGFERGLQKRISA